MNPEQVASLFLRITASPNCNLRCEYCNPSGLFDTRTMSDVDLLESIKAAYVHGIRTVHWTGGEPTLRKGITNLIRNTTQIGIETQSMTTNGVLFGKMAEELKEAGLSGASISLDSLRRERFRDITGRDVLSEVQETIIKSCDLFPRVVVNMVVMRKNFDEISDFIDFARRMKARFVPRFCELQNYGPAYESDPNLFAKDYVSRDEIIGSLQQLGCVQEKQRRVVDQENAHAEYYQLGNDNLVVGVIAPYSHGWPCAGPDCGRIRIGPTGVIKSCVYDRSRTLEGLSYTDKLNIMGEVIETKVRRNAEDTFPKKHIPAYKQLRFGMIESD